MLVFGLGWILWRARSGSFAQDAAPEPAPLPRRLREMAQSEGFDIAEVRQDGTAPGGLRPLWLAALPVLAVVVLNGVFVWLLLPLFDTSYLVEDRWGATTFESVKGIWAIILALSLTIVLIVLTNRRRLPALTATLSSGVGAAALPLLSTAVLVDFGTVVAALPAFAVVRDAVLGIAPENPLISLGIAMNVLAGITGSASGGMSIALSTMGDAYLARGLAAGISPEVMHRVAAIAAGGLDALPQNGAVVTLLAVCRLTHRQAYGDIFMVACIGPILATVVVVALAS